jgi:UDP-N-acetylglucosamine:LPS N-acetylglucosamine transferase
MSKKKYNKNYKRDRASPEKIKLVKKAMKKIKETDPDSVLYTIGYAAGVGIILSAAFDAFSLEIFRLIDDIFLEQ